MLHMQNLRKVYRTALVETHALRDFNLDVKAGEFVAVTGPSGSGKTTFLNIAGLLEEHTDGLYQLDGIDVRHLDDDARSRLRNQKIGFIFQSFNLIPDLDLYDNVDVPLRYRGLPKAERKRRIESVLARVGLGSRLRHHPTELSGGQQQRVAIARALACEPKLLLADEPTGNLDTVMARGVMELLEEINQSGTTIVMVTHDLELARRAGRHVHMVDGQVVDLAEQPFARVRAVA
jgi:putative ABC transport system ATP-binding protein